MAANKAWFHEYFPTSESGDMSQVTINPIHYQVSFAHVQKMSTTNLRLSTFNFLVKPMDEFQAALARMRRRDTRRLIRVQAACLSCYA